MTSQTSNVAQRIFHLLAGVAIVFDVGCHTMYTSTSIPAAHEPPLASEGIEGTLDALVAKRDALAQTRSHFAQRRNESFARLKASLGDQYAELLEWEEDALSLRISTLEKHSSALIHAREVALYGRLVDSADQRLATLEHAILETESWARYVSDAQALGGSAGEGAVMKAQVIAEQDDSTWSEITGQIDSADIARELYPLLAREREELEKRRQHAEAAELARLQREEEQRQREEARRVLEQQEQERLTAERREEQERQEKARQQAALAEARRVAEAQRVREELAAQASNEARARKLYGIAYHAYFDGRYSESASHLDEAIALNDKDPRLYYFRGLAKYRLGDTDACVADFQRGGDAEYNSTVPVGAALERVQGRERLLLEEYRP